MGAVLVDSYRGEKALTGPALAAPFARRGDFYVSASPTMVRQSFRAEKAPDEFRVFILGSSEAMGAPYVNQKLDFLSGALVGMPKEGGISTWLAKYLERLLPGRRITVVNAAEGGGDMTAAAFMMRAVAEIGQPDLVVLLEGNNERRDPEIRVFDLDAGADLKAVLARLSRRFERGLNEFVALAEQRRIPAYLLTVPNNLRDWRPQGGIQGIDDKGLEALIDRRPREAVRRFGILAAANRESSEYRWLLGRALDRAGDFLAARTEYIRAKDLDRRFQRARTPYNRAILSVRGDYARPLDMERVMFGYARDGIPGDDLFHDSCHLKLAANRIVAFEIARRIRADLGLSRPVALLDAKLAPFAARQIRRLYLVKAFKWARAAWFSERGGVGALNAESTLARYRQDARTVEEQIELFQESQR